MQRMIFSLPKLIGVILLGIGWKGLAQMDSTSKKQPLDTTYIRKYPDLLTVGFYSAGPIMEVRIFPEDDSLGLNNQYKGNFASSVGFSAGYRGISVVMGFKTAPDPYSVTQKGQSTYKNLQVKFRWKAIYAAASSSKFIGFYDQNTANSYGKLPDSTQSYAIRPDISYRQRVLSVTGNLSWKKYSYSGPYSYTERQIKSKAGFLLRGALGHMQLKGDSALTHSKQDSAFRNFQHVKKLNAFMIKGGPGVGLTLVFLKRFYAATTLFLQFNTIMYQYTNDENKVTSVRSSISSFAEGSLGLGFNSKRLFMGMHLNGISNRIKLGDARIDYVMGNFSLDLGYRFNCPKSLKKLWANTLTKYFRL